MALYRETATGFVQEWATNPGAGYTAITAQPTDTINNKVAWWRALDTFSQTSDWHPSLPGTPEYPGTDTRAGNGVNILPSDYASFEWAGSLPPMYLANALVNRSTAAKYHGTYGVRYSVTLAGGVAIFAKDSSTYNIPINPNGKWIVSAYVRPVDNAVRTVSLQLTTTAGNTYTVTGNTLGNNASWVRITGVFNLSADASVAARFAISQAAANVNVDIDAIMLEEKVGPLDTPSTFNSPWGTGISTEQYPDYGIPQTKLYQDLATRIDLIDGAAGVAGSVNARIKTETDARTSADSAISSTVTTLTASVNTNSAAIQTESTARASADSALSSSVSTLSTTVSGNTASISTQQQTINGLTAQYMVKLDVNGYVAGFGLYNNGAGASGFIVRADSFSVAMPGYTAKIPFYVDSTGTYIYDAFIKNLSADKIKAGTLSADCIAAGSITVGKLSFTPLTAGSAAGDINAYTTQITGARIQTGSIVADKIDTRNLTIKDAAGTTIFSAGVPLSSTYIASLTADKISSGTLNAANITVNNLRADSITVGTLTTSQISGGAISNVVQDLRTYDQYFYNSGWTTVLQISFPAVAAGTRGPIQFMSTMEMRNWHALYWMAMSGDVVDYYLKGYGQNAKEFAAIVRIVRIGGTEINRVSTTMSFIHNSTSVAISGSDPNPGDAAVTYYVQAFASSWSDSSPDARIGSGSFVGMELKR
jgi:hypothetical protein